MKKIRLIVNADDFGWTRGISDGILLAYRSGIVTSTSLMVNQPATRYAVQQLPSAPGLSVGVHLNLTDGRPVLPARQVPTLVDSGGAFHALPQFLSRLWRLRIRWREIEAEFCAQIRRMKSMGLTPTHADTHHHLHMHPLIAPAFMRALRAEGIQRARQYNPFHAPAETGLPERRSRLLARRVLVRAYVATLRWLFFRRLDSPDAVVVPHPSMRVNPAQLDRGWHTVFQCLPAGTFELGCHPGLPVPEPAVHDLLRHKRMLELSVLTDPQLRKVLSSYSVELISYSQL